MVFTLLLNFVAITGAFPFVEDESGKDLGNTGKILNDTTDYTSGGMDWVWVVGIGGVALGVVAGALMHSVVPIGISIFGSVFWASFINVHGILSIGGYIPSDILTIFTVCVVFIFIAAIIGMLTGSG